MGESRADYRMACICSIITNLAISIHGKKGKTKMTTPYDFMPDWDGLIKEKEDNKKQTPEEMKEVLMHIFKNK